MKYPDSMWTCVFGDGTTLRDRVGDLDPTCLPLADVEAFRNVWKQRRDDGIAGSIDDLVAKSERVLNFLSNNQQIYLLLWPTTKTTALFAPQRDEVLLLD
jgi:hypothetical protein